MIKFHPSKNSVSIFIYLYMETNFPKSPGDALDIRPSEWVAYS